ncbi:hypothetical protein SmJEL517_g01058 [Synchytrium microbalum]|uniref:Rab-GAP TBC domain-containing protein n=1 Tax=Synchytrium microbalum TaxID=1806994 RepID=A0A507CCC8_9FUNG|nr:uncharacterized protein SmJEL517_g01058 [Synchytrium microbalum]TPX37151.1 hypothetical protein SmJEL517_g01058 [Synchytrium microbalum]
MAPPPSRTVFTNDARNGPIWTSLTWRRILAGEINTGPLLRTINAVYSSVSNSTSRPIPFTCVCFSRETAIQKQPTAELNLGAFSCLMAAIDQRGFIYVMDFLKNKWSLVARTGVSGTCASFNNQRRRELLVGLSDCSIICFNTESGQLVAKLPTHHMSEPTHISTHPTQPLAITTSDTEAILWETETFTRRRVLMGAASVGVQQACFDANGENIIGHFSDGAVMVWSVVTFDLTWRFSISSTPLPAMSIIPKQSSYIAISHDGEYLVIAGRSPVLRVWNLLDHKEVHQVTIPDFGDQYILQIGFVGTGEVVALLSSSGQILFANIKTAELLGRVLAQNTFKSFAVSPDGSLLSAIMADSRHITSLLRVDAILKPETAVDTSPELQGPVEQEEPITTKQVPSIVATRPKTFHELVESREESNTLNKGRLRKFLDHYGVYPERYRTLIWRFLLKLPENREAFDVLMSRGIHPAVKDFRKRFPLKSDRLAKTMERILSGLAYWSPLFESLDYLAPLVFPFAYLMVNDTFMCFEAVMTILINWCQKWWEYYPNPPVELLSMFEELFMYHDRELLAHFVKHKVTSQIFLWTFTQNLFSELFVREEWLRVMDHILTNGPAFLWYFALAYLIHFKPALLRLEKLDDFKFFFQRANPVALTTVMNLAYRLRRTSPPQHCPSTFLEPFIPISHGQYPIYNRFPKFVIDYQVRMRERIRKEEEDYMRKRKTTEEIKRLTEDLRRDKRTWEVADQRMNDMVDKWWDSMVGEDKTHEAVQARLDAMELEQRAKALREIAEGKKRYIPYSRKAFIEHTVSVARQQASTLSRAVGENRRAAENRTDRDALDAQLGNVANEWLERRDEIFRAREESKKRELDRVERFAERGRDAGADPNSSKSPLRSTVDGMIGLEQQERVARTLFGESPKAGDASKTKDDESDEDDSAELSAWERELHRISKGKARAGEQADTVRFADETKKDSVPLPRSVLFAEPL